MYQTLLDRGWVVILGGGADPAAPWCDFVQNVHAQRGASH